MQDKDKFASEDLGNTMEVPVTKNKTEDIFDPWQLKDENVDEDILNTIAELMKKGKQNSEKSAVDEDLEEKVLEEETVSEEEISEETEEAFEEPIAPEILEEPEEENVSGFAAEPEKVSDNTTPVPVVTPETPEIIREEADKKRLWVPALVSSFLLIFACVVTLAVGIVPTLVQQGVARGLTQIIAPVITPGEPLARTNVLLFGVDKDGYRTDTMMVATYDKDLGQITIMQLPRDSYVHNNKRANKKLNSAYFGGIDQLKAEVEMAYGIEIHKYVEVNLDGFRLLIDAIGGVEVDVPINMIYDDPFQDFHIYLLKGRQVLNGDKAEQFVRFRQNNDGSGYPMGDLQRMEVQREFIKTTIKQMISMESIKNIDELIKVAQDNLDTNLTFEEIYNYAMAVLTQEDMKIEFITAPGVAPEGSSYFIINYDEAQKIAQKYFYATEKTMSGMAKVEVKESYTEEEETGEEEPSDDEEGRRDEEEEEDTASAITRPDDEEEEPPTDDEEEPADEEETGDDFATRR